MASEYSSAKRELLEKYLRGQMGGQRKVSTIPRRQPGERIPLTHAQEQIWVHAQLAPHLPIYNEPVTIHYCGALDTEALERSFNEMLRRHESWRTSINIVDGEPVQVVHDSLSVSLPLIDLTQLPREQREPAALQIAADDAREPFDLGKAPLFRARLVRMDELEFRLHLTLCHIIFDGVALDRVFLPELAALYKAYTVGESSPLSDPPIQYPDYACWEKKTLTPEALSNDIGYWREKLSGHLPELYLPADHRSPRSRTFRGSMYRCKLRAPLMKRIREFCAREGVSPFHVTFAAFSALLRRCSGEERIPVGIVTAGRTRPETETLLGYFLNTLVIPADTSGNPSFRALVRRVRDWSIEAIEHGQMPFEYLVRELKVQRDPSRNPIFQALFSLEKLPAIDSTWRLTQADVDTGTTKYDLYLKLDEQADEIVARFHYSTDLFERDSIARMAMHWKTLLRNAIASPDRALSDVSLLNAREHRTLLKHSYVGPTNYPKECIHALFEQQAGRTPDALAVVSEGQSISYRDLNEQANRIAHLLLQRALPNEALVGLSMERGTAMVAALLGILKAGAAYVPLDPRLPDERLAYLLADSKPAAIITDERSLRQQFKPDAIVLDASFELVKDESAANPRVGISPNHLAYVLYTSGSTGNPKGVGVEHRSVVNLLRSMQQEPGINSNDVLLAVTTLSFDIAGLEIFLPLITGARLVLAGSNDVVDGVRLRQLLEEHQATLMQATPASWRMLIEAGWPGSANLKILCGGEALPAELAKELIVRSPSVWNVYGPTETTIWSSIYRVNGQEEDLIPIGRPVANTAIYVTDGHGNLVPPNTAGEIYIGGDGLARGYWNQPELTAQRFVSNWLAPDQSSRVYRTGDLGRWNGRGQLEYLGRIDTQIKLRGMRIELGEIESVLASHPQVRQAVVTVKGDADQQKLCAFLVAKSTDARLDVGDLRRHLRSKLPEHMLPTEYWQLETIPLLPSGKVNRGGLSRSTAVAIAGETCVGPRYQTEILLTAIWSELLKVRVIGIDQNFFDLGGHSLLVLQMVSRIRRLLEVDLPARSVFEAPTILALAQEIEKARTLGPPMRSNRAAEQEPTFTHRRRFPGKAGQNLLDSTLDEKQANDPRISPAE